MSKQSFEELWNKLRIGDESVEIEAKRATEIGSSILETISAFANEPHRGGGYLLLGIAPTTDSLFPDYEVVGVKTPDRLQADLATQCRDAFNLPLRPDISVEQYKGGNVVIAFINEAQPHENPIYIKSKGKDKGSFRRIGSTDQHCTDEDLALFYQLRTHKTFDETPIPETAEDDFDPSALSAYRRARADISPNAPELGYSDQDLLFALNATTKHQGTTCATIAGLLLFGKQASLRRHFPLTRVDYIRVEGRAWVPDPDERYQTVEMSGPLLLLIPRLIGQVFDDIPKTFSLAQDGNFRKEIPLIPRKVIREAIVNALMHRSYRLRQPVQIIRYSNRIEIRNPGYSLVPDERLGEPGSMTRNEKIAAVLHEAGLAETKGTGIRVMLDAMKQANLTAPLFESDRQKDSFTATLLVHHLLDPADIAWLANFKEHHLTPDETRALIVVRELGAITNLDYRRFNDLDTLSASKRLQRLRDVGLLEQKGKGNQTYYIPTSLLLNPLKEAEQSQLSGQLNPSHKTLSDQLNPSYKTLSDQLNPSHKATPESLQDSLPAKLRSKVETLGERSTTQDLRNIIFELCTWKDLRPAEIATLIRRSRRYLRARLLTPMVRDGLLELTYSNPSHPKQAYRAVTKEKP